MNLVEKVAFIKGLADGMKLDTETPEGKILSHLIEVIGDIAVTVSELDEDYCNLSEQVDAIDEDLFSLEEDFYHEEDSEDEDPYYEVTCPTCNETICLSEDVLLSGEISCPNCNEELEFDFDSLRCDEDNCFDPECDCD